MRAKASPAPANKPIKRRSELRPSARPSGQLSAAFERLARHQALQTLVRGALPPAQIRRLLGPALPTRQGSQLPEETWASLAGAIAAESPEFQQVLAQLLDDALSWDHAPATLDEWWPVVRERPLEALWMGALSDDKAVRREFKHIVAHCLDNFRNSPACKPPTWNFVEALLEVHALLGRDLSAGEHALAEASRRLEAERERHEELREELRKLRRENAELRAARARLERRQDMHAPEATTSIVGAGRPSPAEQVSTLERRVRKLEKERSHLATLLERQAVEHAHARLASVTPAADARTANADPQPATPDGSSEPLTRPDADPNPRRRVLRKMLRRLLAKGKIGASHTHEDNVYRSLADHEKGLAKQAMDLLYREGLLLPKPTLTDPHLSLEPERLAEIHALVAGQIDNPRLRRFVEE
jgi:hypothetical protein